MIILSWNIRGLGAKIKRSSLRSLINHHKPHFVFVQEKKIENFNPRIIMSFWKDSQVQRIASPSQGQSGGLISLWDANFFHLTSSHIEKHWIAMCVEITATQFKCTLLNVYNPCSVAERSLVWQSIIDFQNSSHLPCLLLGDFSEVLDQSEQGSQLVSTNGLNDFKVFLQELQVLEISATNGKFTWFRGHSKSKLDRFLVAPEWITKHPSMKLSLLKRSISSMGI